jgi:uncharacterized membrane protein
MRQRVLLDGRWTFLSTLLIAIFANQASSRVDAQAVDTGDQTVTQSGVIDFERDIAPLLAKRCLECHGPKDAKNEFRVDDAESLMGYVEAGDVGASALWTDYLRSEDPDMQMPPVSHGGPLPATEWALIQVWIQEGAVWPSGAVVTDGSVPEAKLPVMQPTSLFARVWAFQGYLHPATVHFPIALLLVGGVFVVVGWRYPVLGQNVSLVCLFLGTLSAIVASIMGWAFAPRRGYGGWDRIDMDSEIFWHRWSAVIVTTVAIATSAVALRWLQNRSPRLGKMWKGGLLAAAMMIGAVGHQGGELTYGEKFYQEAFDLLFGRSPESAEPVATPETVAAVEP